MGDIILLNEIGDKMRGKRNLTQPGDTFGKLTVSKRWTESRGNKSKETICECVCECGSTIIVPARYLRSGHKKSCGCIQFPSNNKHPSWKGCGKVSSSTWTSIKYSAKNRSREIEFSITIEYVSDLFDKQQEKCAITGIPIQFTYKNARHVGFEHNTASLDRIDSTKGYIEGNVQWVHKNINLMKMHLSQDDFIKFCKLVAENN